MTCKVKTLISSLVSEDNVCPEDRDKMVLFLQKLAESARSTTKRMKERLLEEAAQMLKKIPAGRLQLLESKHLHLLVQLVLSLQLEAVSTSLSACRRLDQMLQHLAQVDQSLLFGEVQKRIYKTLHQQPVLSVKDLQIVSMFLEESVMGREALRQAFTSLLGKVTELLPVVMKEDATRNGLLCYQTVKLCLQMFQLLPEDVTLLLFAEQRDDRYMRDVLGFLMKVIIGVISKRDTRLLAGSAVAMLISTAPDCRSGAASAWSLLQVTSTEQWSLSVGMLEVDCYPEGSDGVDRLAVARGLLTCCRQDILISQHHDQEICLLLDGLFPLISALLKEKQDYHYYVFQVFVMWLKSVKACLPGIWTTVGAPLLGVDSNLQHKLTQIIWDDAESPVEGVSESVRTAFALFLEIYEQDCQHSGDTEKRLYVELLHRFSELPWKSKAKYSPLSVLLPYVGTDKLLERYPALPSHILKCLSVNHLAPCAYEIYSSLLQQQRQALIIETKNAPPTEQCLADQWAQRWQPIVLKALTSDATLLQNNASSYLLPCTLRCFPQTFHTMQAALDPCRTEHLRAWVCIMSAYRATSGLSPWGSDCGVTQETLQLALSSLDDSVRIAAFNLLCCSPKTKEAPSEVEYSAMRKFLPLNLNSESSPFRQHLQAGVRKFLARIRDSCMASLKAPKNRRVLCEEDERKLEEGIDFIDWLAQLPLVCLVPGSSYQRKKTALLLLAAVLETCSDSWSPDRKKGQPPADMAELINWARKRDKWDFYSESRQLVLIACLEDITNEIRDHSAELLLRFFPPSLPVGVAASMFSRAQKLVHSPRFQEAQMGALITKLLLQKCVSLDSVAPDTPNEGEKESARMIRYLLKNLEQQYLTAEQDMLLAARSFPLHGTVSALQKCMLEVPGVLMDAVDYSVITELLSVLEKMTQLLLGVLSGDQNNEDNEELPSFCDMGNAISSLIGHGGALLDEEGEENVLLSEEHSLVLTCCWVTLKEMGIFLGMLVERILSDACKDRGLLTVKDLQQVSKVFKDIILKCRHWGAVEGCCIGFTKFCAALLNSHDPEFREIPSHILQQGLFVLQSPRTTSVTRRAAGLPMLILGVLAAEESSTSRPLLANTVNTLLETARVPLPDNWDQTLDLPQVCAVHTLQALMRGSSLGSSILQYAPSITMLSLTLLSSPCWSMRNAALQLYSSLCSRMLGQRSAGEDVSAQYGMSPPSFFTHYPALKPFLLGALEAAATDLHEARLCLHPSLYPVLTLLAKLQPGAPEPTRALSGFLRPLFQLAASPVYGVRVMSSQALVAMIPPTDYVASVLQLLQDLPETPNSQHCHNRVHGQLLQINAILTRALHTHHLCSSSLRGVIEALEARLWMASPELRCPLVRMVYLAVLSMLREHFCGAFLTRLGSLLLEELRRSPHALELGSALFHQTAVHYLCEDPDLAVQVWTDLFNGSAVIRLSLVKWVKGGQSWKEPRLQQVLERALQINLKEALLDQDIEYKGAYLSALVEVMTQRMSGTRPALSEFKEAELLECVDLLLEDLEKSRGGPELLAHTLCALSLLLSQTTELGVLHRWCVLLETQSRPEVPEAFRMACAQSLVLTGAAVVTLSLTGCPLKALSTRLVSTAVHLLQDQSQQVRAEAAVFASLLCQSRARKPKQSCFLMQSNQSLLMLLDLLLEEFWDSKGTLEALVCHFPECDLLSILQEATATQCSSLYKQDKANMYQEPSVISETVLPYLLRLAKRYPESSSLSERLDQWQLQNVVSVREDLRICKKLCLGNTMDPDWLSVLMEQRFHGAVCGMYAKAAFLLQLLGVSRNAHPVFDPSILAQDLLDVHRWFSLHGVFLPNTFIQHVRTEPGEF